MPINQNAPYDGADNGYDFESRITGGEFTEEDAENEISLRPRTLDESAGQENVKALRQNGKIFWIRRALKDLPTDGRPLSVDLEELYQKRLPCYEAAADGIVENDGTAGEAADRIIAMREEAANDGSPIV